jgi:dipeptidyl aminopeptidase/acylaminoacyl peptidase
MAHCSYLSPDGKSVLLAEMENNGWRRCRVVPFDGSNAGFQVGPPGSSCTTGAWSPDGQFVYFSADTGKGMFHIWRQRVPDGTPEQVTSGPSEEEGIAMAPDGESFITSVGQATSTVWIHDAKGERQVTSEGYAEGPRFSPDGSKLYYLVSDRGGSSFTFQRGRLWVADLVTHQSESVFEDFSMASFDISPDGKRVLFSSTDGQGTFHVWLGKLDKRSSPQQLTSFAGEDTPVFGQGGLVFFRAVEKGFNYIYRMREDGSERKKISADSIFEFEGVSPDGKLAFALTASSDESLPLTTLAFRSDGIGPPTRVCYFACNPRWSPDAKFLYLSFPVRAYAMTVHEVLAVELKNVSMLPNLPASGIRSAADLAGVKVTKIFRQSIFPGTDPSTYTFTQKVVHYNLYRVPVPQ